MYIESDSIYDVACFNEVRKMLEWIRNLCIERGILPDSVKELNKFSKFLCDENMKDDVPLYVQRSLHSCIVVSQEGSHLLTIDKAVKRGEALYLLRSTVFELLNVLYWCKSLPNDAESIEARRAKTMELTTLAPREIVKSEVFEGIIERDTSHRYFCGEYLFSNDMQPNDSGKRVKINIKKRKDNTDFRTKDIYPYFVYRRNCEIFE